MSRSKKPNTPKVDPRVMTRPRLDALFERQARGVKPVTYAILNLVQDRFCAAYTTDPNYS